MIDPHCKIGKVTLKGGAELVVFPNNKENYVTFGLGWGEVTFRIYDDDILQDQTILFMLRMVEHDLIHMITEE